MNGRLTIGNPALTGKSLSWSIHLDNLATEHYQYAYYVSQNGGVIMRTEYENVSDSLFDITLPIMESGSYKIQVFLKKMGELLFNENSAVAYADLSEGKLLNPYFYKEDIYFNDIPVNYVFHPAPSDYLVICFAGISSQEYQGKSPVYNYIRTLDDVPVNRLYILDSYKDRFCYYLGKGGQRDFEKAVMALITKIANEYNIKASRIITAGSSKGGTAALYYALTYNYGRAIVGAPQIHISTFLKSFSKNKYIHQAYKQLVGKNSVAMDEYLNQLLYSRLVGCQRKPTLFFHVGREDYHYNEHLRPFITFCDAQNIEYQLDIGEYQDHSETGTFFAPLLKEEVLKIIKGET